MKKIAFISGASGGIGQAIARELSATHTLLLHSFQHGDVLKKLKNELEEKGAHIYLVQGDLSDEKEATRIFQQTDALFPYIHTLINCAGIADYQLFTHINYARWKELFQVNVDSIFQTCHHFLPKMIENKSGKIINISSVWGIVGASLEVAYSATKGAVNAFTKALALEEAYSNIQVNAIAPGAVDTNMLSPLSDEDRRLLIRDIPAGRLAHPEEIAKLAAFLASPAADYITGQIISPNGGFMTY